MNPCEPFRDAMRAMGIDYAGEIIADGELHRFKAAGDKRPNGWYVLHADERPAGMFGHYSRGIERMTWRPAPDRAAASAVERAKWTAERLARENIERERRRTALERLQRDWAHSLPAHEHPYLARKAVGAYGVRLGDSGALLVPMRDAAGLLVNLQTITASGDKRYRKWRPVHGAMHAIGNPAGLIGVAEGYATAASLHECTGHAVAVAFSANNLAHVAIELRKKYPRLDLLIAADHDASGAGQRYAQHAAETVAAYLAMPPQLGDDFNDLHRREGAPAVRAIFSAVLMGAHV